ncbi:MAG: hypothetical protein KF775_03940 [Cyclobacteriaceae bacterium]|nr:hypothetical protein [Cyclobacteriaceae bacterium]
MAAVKNQRIKSLSTRYLGFYKTSLPVLFSIVIGFFVWGAYQLYIESGKWFHNTYMIFYFLFLIWGWVRINRNVHRVEFDDEFLYVIQKGQDILIPLENIKEVDIKTLGGVYEVELFQAEQLGNKFYFKPSLLYPFNYKRKDELVNVLRRNINRAYQKKQEFQRNVLQS